MVETKCPPSWDYTLGPSLWCNLSGNCLFSRRSSSHWTSLPFFCTSVGALVVGVVYMSQHISWLNDWTSVVAMCVWLGVRISRQRPTRNHSSWGCMEKFFMSDGWSGQGLHVVSCNCIMGDQIWDTVWYAILFISFLNWPLSLQVNCSIYVVSWHNISQCYSIRNHGQLSLAIWKKLAVNAAAQILVFCRYASSQNHADDQIHT